MARNRATNNQVVSVGDVIDGIEPGGLSELPPDDDELPLRYYQPKTDGILATKSIVDQPTMAKAKKWYYYYMGWDEKGVPITEKLVELGLA